MNIVISDPKTGKAYSKKTEEAVFLNKHMGDEVELTVVGLNGYKATITGGSDKQGFPMKSTLEGEARKKILIQKGTGFRNKIKGMYKRKTVRGNIINEEIMQINLRITKHGSTKLGETIQPEKKEDKVSTKDKLIQESLEHVGDTEYAGDAKTAKGKVRK